MNTWWIVRLVAALTVLSGLILHAQQPPGPARVYENEIVRVTIPAGWSPANGNHPAIDPIEQSPSKLLLQKEGFTLALAFEAERASGIVGGRFIEMFRIPWLDPNDAWTCSTLLTRIPQPVSRRLLFFSLQLETGDPRVREKCGIPRDLGEWRERRGQRELVGYERWLGGYFSTDAGWFFDSEGVGCKEQAYTLSTAAQTPPQLPMREDPRLSTIISEAIDIVASIQYKRCPPVLTPYASAAF